MEHFRNAKVVRLLSHHNKYLTADDDAEDGVRQDRSGASRGARWQVELVEGRTDAIRLKSCCFNRYLAASDKRFLLGATGRKVVLLPLPRDARAQSLGKSVEWQPVRDGKRGVKLRTRSDTFLRANGLVKPYGNTVTHGNPHRTATQDWVIWEVDVVELLHHDDDAPPKTAVPTPVRPIVPDVVSTTPPAAPINLPGAPVLKLYDPGRDSAEVVAAAGSSKAAADASVTRSSSTKSDVSMSSCVSSDEECGTPHSHRPSTSHDVEPTARPPLVLSISSDKVSDAQPALPISPTSSSSSTVSSPIAPWRGSFTPRPVLPHLAPSTLSPVSSMKNEVQLQPSDEGRLVQYFFADDDGEVDDTFESGCFEFHGSTVQQLIHNVEVQIGLDDFILCKRNIINDSLYRLRLTASLPPDGAPMTIFIVHPMSKVAKQFL